jgi:hypothetical protein
MDLKSTAETVEHIAPYLEKLKGVWTFLQMRTRKKTMRIKELEEQVQTLREQAAERNKVEGPIPPFTYCYRMGDRQHPICPMCWQQRRLIMDLSEVQQVGYDIGRFCDVCGWVSREKPTN